MCFLSFSLSSFFFFGFLFIFMLFSLFCLNVCIAVCVLFTSYIRHPFPLHPSPPPITSFMAESPLWPSIPALPPLLLISQPITAAHLITWLTEEQEDKVECEPYTTQLEAAATQPLPVRTGTNTHMHKGSHIGTQTEICTRTFRKQVCRSQGNNTAPFSL